MSVERRYKASFHGHSPYSDGLSPIKDLVKEAQRAEITFFGISDHNTSNGLPRLYQEIAQLKDAYGIGIIPVSAVEITTTQGDVIIAKPGDFSQEFCDWSNRWSEQRQSHGLAKTINTAVNDFDAIAVIAHPGEPKLASTTLELIEQLPELLSKETISHVGLEVRNWSTRLMPKRASVRELKVLSLTRRLKLAQFGFADFHHAWQIPTQYTFMETDKPTPEGFMDAVKQRKVFPGEGQPVTSLNWSKLCLTFIITHLKQHKLY